MTELKFTYVAPEMIYTCPMTEEYFGSHREHCLSNPPCLYFNCVKKDGIGDVMYFDIIVCEYQSSETSTRDENGV